jgi:hypothetical protein
MIALLHFFELSRKTVLPLYFFIVKSLFSTLTGRFDYFIVKLKLLASFSIFFFQSDSNTIPVGMCSYSQNRNNREAEKDLTNGLYHPV